MTGRTVRIGCASGFWGDSAVAAPQLVRHGRIDYLVFDYLAELTLSLLARAKLKDPAVGYATDFVTVAMRATLRDVAAKGIRVISNAGGLNPQGCAAALAKLAESLGVAPKIAVIEGDDLLPRIEEFRDARDLQSGAAMPARMVSANAYLGAFPIAEALRRGAQIVITGRCVDSAVTLGALIHEFGWTPSDLDKLAGGSLAGHILECGAQGTGGLHTDWENVPDWPNIGYPIAECAADGSFVVTKPENTGGLVAVAPVAEQMLYEVHDPGRYVLPDVTCDFTAVRIEAAGEHRVRVSGARGSAPPERLKVAGTYADGYRLSAQLTIIGIDAARKAKRTAEAILSRTRGIFRALNLGDYRRTLAETLGAESAYGPHGRAGAAREVILRLTAEHADNNALEILAREVAPAGTSWSPGTTGGNLGRQSPAPVVKLFSFLVPRAAVRIAVDGEAFADPVRAAGPEAAPARYGAMPAPEGPFVEWPLVRLAFARSGDKGDAVNIGVVARHADFLPVLAHGLTAERVAAYFAYCVQGPVSRHDVPGIGGFNFVLDRALDGGGMASLRNDPLGKGFAQILLDCPLRVPRALAAKHGLAP